MNSNAQIRASASAAVPTASVRETFKRAVALPLEARLESAVIAVCFLMPLVVVPGLEHPFSTPRLFVLLVSVALGVPATLLTRKRKWPALPSAFSWALAVWLAALGASALIGEFVSVQSLSLALAIAGWFLLVMTISPNPRRIAVALAGSGVVLSCVACLQFLGWDPFAAAGWISMTGSGARMRVFATLGNPNFVAAFLVGLMPLTHALATTSRRKVVYNVALAVQGVAVFASGSRAAILGMTAAVIWLVVLGSLRRWRTFALAAIAISIALLAFSPARNLSTTVRGRGYILRTIAGHIADQPFFGHGPGSFAPQFAEWDSERWKTGSVASRNREFAGPEDHAHNDYVEIFIEQGAIGLIAFLSLLIGLLIMVFRRRNERDPLIAAPSAGAVALAAVAMVDFPFHRPTEIFLFWTLIAIALLSAANRDGTEIDGTEKSTAAV